MILPWPLTTSTEIARMLRPGGDLRPDSALRALRDKELPAEPISVVARSARAAHGRAVWYSSLMLDVARLVRVNEPTTARALHGAANHLASHRAARAVAEQLLRAGTMFDPSVVDAESGGALTRLAILTESSRREHEARLGVATVSGRIIAVTNRTATLLAEDGTRFVLPRVDSAAVHGERSLVSVDTEALLGGAMAVWVRTAFESDVDQNERAPSDVHLLSSAERERLGGPVTATG